MGRDVSSLMTSDYDEWETPEDLFLALDKEFCFDLDAAASAVNSKCEHFIDKEIDALTVPWHGRVFVNPPYGKATGLFLKKAYEECKSGNVSRIVLLVPARTDTVYWHDYAMKAPEIRFIKGRVKFGAFMGGHKLTFSSAPFPSALVIFYQHVWPDSPLVSTYTYKSEGEIPMTDTLDDDFD